MTAKRDALVRCTRGVVVLGLLTGAGVLTAPASAATTSYITTMRSTQGKVIFSLRAMSITTRPVQQLQGGGYWLPKSGNSVSLSAVTATYRETNANMSKFTALPAAAPLGFSTQLIVKVMSGRTCELKELFSRAWVSKYGQSSSTLGGKNVNTMEITYVVSQVKRISC